MTKLEQKSKFHQEAKHEDLGHVLDYFPIRNHKLIRWLTLITGVIAILAAIVLSVKLFINLINAIQIHGRAMVLGIIPFPTAIYLTILVGGILFVVLAKLHWWDGIILFKNGFIRNRGCQKQVWYYEKTNRFDNNVTQIKFGGSMIGDKTMILLEDGSKNRLVIQGNFIRTQDLIQSLRASILPGLFQRARQQLEGQLTIHFHNNLSASHLGIEIDQAVIPYQAIHTEIKNRTVKLQQKANSGKLLFKSSINRIRNLDLLLDLLDNPPNPID